ncbi:polymeric immunoglobulin receptor isoform X1 [Fundulus heteroclitus]|uniref:polymeric immunoglobulin receptor isoform X1 n=2 Tax=Fundulus heteroclitus TaxID=8078 RepID=UPI00165B4BA3|nr:polymeric immunoglobulin receptor isoform X1 [Fundulus heteroclitus]
MCRISTQPDVTSIHSNFLKIFLKTVELYFCFSWRVALRNMKMFSLHILLFMCCALSCVTSDEDVIPVFGYEDSDAVVSCPYAEGYEDYEKYLCKDDCGSDDVLITTSEINEDKYSIDDDKRSRIFSVTISDLRFEDAGKYWCGVSRTGKDIYTEVKLEVGKDIWGKTPAKIQGNEEGSVSIRCRYETEPVNNLKYICRGNRLSTCLRQAVVTSNNEQNGRFTLTDDKNAKVFTVTISSLKLSDSGWYLFGVQRDTGSDGFCAFDLKVKEWCCVTSRYVKGTEGQPITMQCPYPPEHRNNRMFICKGNHRSDCTNMMTGRSRFKVDSIFPSYFSVTITNLEQWDAGTYWCRSNSEWVVGDYTQFRLSVGKKLIVEKKVLKDLPEQKQTEVYRLQTSTVENVITASPQSIANVSETSDQGAVLFGLFAVPPALLMIVIIILVIVCKKKCHKVKDTEIATNRSRNEARNSKEVMGGENLYENHDEIVMRSQQNIYKEQNACYHFDDPEDEAHYNSISTTEDIYCNE